MKKFWFLLMYSVLGCGCFFTPQKDNSRFYALGFKHLGSTDSSCSSGARVVYIDLEEIPAYADVSQFVSLKDGCEILRSESVRWGEPFKTSVLRSIYVGLSSQLRDSYSVVMLPIKAQQEHEYRVNIRITNFIFNNDKNELYLTAAITILKQGKLYATCDYSDCVKIRSSDPKAIVNGMDWALSAMSTFIGRCLNFTPYAEKGTSCIPQKQEEPIQLLGAGQQNFQGVSTTRDVASTTPRTITLVSHGEVYVVVDSADGSVRYFSGRLYDGSSMDVQCDGPFKVISTDDSLLEVR